MLWHIYGIKEWDRLVWVLNCKTSHPRVNRIGLASLNVFRLLAVVPKMLNSTESWVAIKMIGNNFRDRRGSKYHFSWLSSAFTSSNAILIRSPNSQTANIDRSVHTVCVITVIISTLFFRSSCWKNGKQVEKIEQIANNEELSGVNHHFDFEW